MSNIDIYKHSGLYSVHTEQLINIEIEEAWDFFTKAANLQKITPPEMNFKITGPLVERTYLGQIITYNIGILPNISSNWVTEITHFEKEKIFVDEQRFGPYSMWHHEHHFIKVSENTCLMKDIIHYKLPFGSLGNLFLGKIIQKKVKSIFEYRFEKVNDFFNKKP